MFVLFIRQPTNQAVIFEVESKKEAEKLLVKSDYNLIAGYSENRLELESLRLEKYPEKQRSKL